MTTPPPLATGPRVTIRRLVLRDRAEVTALSERSHELHGPWVPRRGTTEAAFRSYVARFDRVANEGFVVCLRDSGAIVGGVNINTIVRGALQSGALGYAGYAPSAGRGYVAEGVALAARYAFDDLSLHRLEANVQPDNERSLRLVRRLGFRYEGFSPSFLHINGAWRDHERWALTAEMPLSFEPAP